MKRGDKIVGNQHNQTDYSVVDWDRSFHGKTTLERFWEKVNIADDPDDCWEWIAAHDPNGYGTFGVPGFGHRHAHSVSYFLEYGNIPDGRGVCHTCDNRKCVNPRHLFAGTHSENMRDMADKERNGYPDQRGEKHSQSRLIKDDVIFIRESYKCGIPSKVLSKMFGVCTEHINAIVSHKRWKHVV